MFRALRSAPLSFAPRPHKLSEESLIKDFCVRFHVSLCLLQCFHFFSVNITAHGKALVHIKARCGGAQRHHVARLCAFSCKAHGILHVVYPYKTVFPLELWIDGYHYPTLADLLTQVTAVESSVTDLQVALCELYEEKEEN